MTAYLYSYLVGGTVFAIGLGYAAKQGYVGFSGRKLRNLLLSLGVVLFFALLQGYLQFAPMTVTPAKAYTGGAEEVLKEGAHVRGTTLDYLIVAAYFGLILFNGIHFGRRQKTTRDFFFGGQRFAWWLIAISLIATTIGSYSFVKYSEMGYKYGMGATQAYWNDWPWFPLLVFGWLPLLYFSRIVSVPEYFGRRYGPKVRLWATVYLLIYLVGYVGVNLYTMGVVVNILVGWPIPLAALVVAMVSATYVTIGGQSSVIMNDLLNGVFLLLVGALIFVLGASYLGGFDVLWHNLPRDARLAFPNFNQDPKFPSVGIFWQDAFANSAMFYFLNQGIIMRFMAAKSLNESRKAATVMMVGLMFIGALVVASGGLVARAFTHAGVLPEVPAQQAFFVATELLSHPGIFGLILAAMTAALMSTVDTLVTAVSAVTVNDLYRPYFRPEATDPQLLRAARISALSVSTIGVLLVPVFMQFDSIYRAHAAFTAAVTPPMVVALLLAVFWRRFTRAAALWTLAGGLVLMAASMLFPAMIKPFAHGVPGGDIAWNFLAGMREQTFMRACYGIVCCGAIGILVTLFTRPEPAEKQRGLVWGTINDALRHYKGSPGRESKVTRALGRPQPLEQRLPHFGSADLEGVRLSESLARALDARVGDLLYVTDPRWWTGGLHSAHVIVAEITAEPGEAAVALDDATFRNVVGKRGDRPVRIEKLYGSAPEVEGAA
ncbi:MAG: sodium/solute symporter [Verrucomicrobiales bacterium]|nr:sodium/solute symporter [Verrucomicrobiales bacterium]